MTFVPLQVFEKCLRSNGVQDRTEYYELWNRGIIPRKLMPKKPSVTYGERDIKNQRKVVKGVWKNGVFRYFTKAERENRKIKEPHRGHHPAHSGRGKGANLGRDNRPEDTLSPVCERVQDPARHKTETHRGTEPFQQAQAKALLELIY